MLSGEVKSKVDCPDIQKWTVFMPESVRFSSMKVDCQNKNGMTVHFSSRPHTLDLTLKSDLDIDMVYTV